MAEHTVSKKKLIEVNQRLLSLGVTEDQLQEEFIKGSGSGGQKINKTSSCVQLTFLKTGLVIKCQNGRSRELNRFYARRILLHKLEAERLGRQSEEGKRIHKIKAQKKRRSRRAKEKILKSKKIRGELKGMRKKHLASFAD